MLTKLQIAFLPQTGLLVKPAMGQQRKGCSQRSASIRAGKRENIKVA